MTKGTESTIGKCNFCGKKLDDFAGNPSKWSVPIVTYDDPGVVKYYCYECAGKAMGEYIDRKQLDLLTKWI